jgi:nucleoside 2-deoxyribosyltransferase
LSGHAYKYFWESISSGGVLVRIYTAGPLGFSEVGRQFHASIVATLKQLGHTILDPWDFDLKKLNAVMSLPYGQDKKSAWEKLNAEIGENNQRLIDACDVVFAVLDGVDVDSGTAAEIGYACARGKHILGYRGDFRLSADNEGALINLQVEYFIRKSGGTIIQKIEDLPAALSHIG